MKKLVRITEVPRKGSDAYFTEEIYEDEHGNLSTVYKRNGRLQYPPRAEGKSKEE